MIFITYIRRIHRFSCTTHKIESLEKSISYFRLIHLTPFSYEEPIFLHFFHGRIHLSTRIYVRTFWVHTKLTNDDRQRRNCGLHLLYVENFFLYTVKTNSFGGCGTWQIKPIGAIFKAEYSKRPRYYRLNNKNRR